MAATEQTQSKRVLTVNLHGHHGCCDTGLMLHENTKLLDMARKLQSLGKELEKLNEQLKGDSDRSDVVAAAAQVRRSAMEIQQLGYNYQVTVRTENAGHSGNMTSLIILVATLSALGCGYMWWKGFTFSDLMRVTKRNMANAVSNLTKYLEHVTEAPAGSSTSIEIRMRGPTEELTESQAHHGMVLAGEKSTRKMPKMPKTVTVTGIEVQEESEVKECAGGWRVSRNRKAETCMICLEEMRLGSCATQVPCSHLFHTECITKWLRANHSCPLCRFDCPSVDTILSIRTLEH